MKLSRVIIENFMAVGHVEISLAEKGLVLIQGDNRDDSSQESNGAGKSTVLDAVCWALYGETARGEKGDKIVNRAEGKNCRVSVTLDDDGHIYEVTRHRKHSKGKNRLEVIDVTGGNKNLTGGTDKLTQAALVKIIGSSVDVFTGSIYAGQEKMPDLPNMTDKALKGLVEEAAGIDRLGGAYKIAQERAREAGREAERAQDKVQAKIDAIGTAEDNYQRIEAASKQWELDQQQVVSDHSRKILKLREEAVAREKAARERPGDKLRAAIGAIDRKLQGLDDEKRQLAALDDALNDAKISHGAAHRELETAFRTHERLEQACKDVDNLVGTPCDTCGRPFDHDHLDDARKSALAKAAQQASNVAKCQKVFKDTKGAFQSAQKARDDYAASMTDTSDLMRKRAQVQAALDVSDDAQRALDDAKQALSNAVDAYRALRDHSNPHQPLLKDAQESIEKAQAAKDKAVADAEELINNLAVAKATAQVFGPAGVRAHILDTVTPFLNDRTAHYLSILSDGNLHASWSTLKQTGKGEFRENFGIKVSSDTGGDDFGLLSGGEKRKVRVACAMALQDLVASRASKPIELFMADEIDDAVDDAGLERMMTMLEAKARDRGTVLIVSHNELSDWVRESVMMVKEGGKARLEGSALCL